MAQITFKVNVITFSVDKLSLFVARITFVVAELFLKWMGWLLNVVKITLVVTVITFLGTYDL